MTRLPRTKTLLILLTLSTLGALAAGCAESDVTVCEPTGRICPPRTTCTVDGQACVTGTCGNGVKDDGEA